MIDDRIIPDPPPDAGAESPTPTAWAVNCPRDGLVYLTREEYTRQISRVDDLWKCPRCGRDAQWDDDTYEQAMEAEERRDGENEG